MQKAKFKLMLKDILVALMYSTFLVLLSIFIVYSPLIDTFFATIPYNNITHKFYGETHRWCAVVYYMVPVITSLFVVVCSVILLFANTIRKFKRNINNLRRSALIILLSLCVGPGIIVNVIFKDNWGRARPYQVLRDGKLFSPVWKSNLGVHTDNSFPSGHAAIGFFLGVPFLVRQRRLTGLVVSVIGGSVIGAVRVLQGGHYFSDVVLCGVIVWVSAELVLYLVNKLFKKKVLDW